MNIGLPGTGLSIHQRIDAGSKRPTISTKSPPLLSHPDEIPALPTSEKTPPLIGEIRSADNAAITSLGFVELKNLLSRAYDELKRLQSETPGIDAELLRTKDRAYKWTNGILLKHLLKKQYQTILTEHEQSQKQRADLTEEIEKCRIALEIEMDAGIESTYGSVVDTFRQLAACERCWDTTSERAVDKFHERSAAHASITRTAITLAMRSADIVAPSNPCMYFQNANGGDLYLLPGLLLVLGGVSDFALIRLTEIRVEYSSVRFHEHQKLPIESKRLGQTWAKVNKDGSPDRRFANNSVIPIVEYGQLSFSSAAGLRERYMFSNADKTRAFVEAFLHHCAVLPTN